MAGNEFEDKIPKNFIIKVYETKVLAEKGLEKDALYIFDNGIDADGVSSDPRVSNGSQFVSGSLTANVVNKVTDSAATFSDRLVGKILTNLNTGTTAVIDSVDSETVLGFDSDICPVGNEKYHVNAPGHYFTFEKYYYRIEASDVVKGFIIDWDDGEDNSPERANTQTILLDIPNNYTIVEHTYTKHGKFYPMIRTISTEGYYSKWYASYDKRYDAENAKIDGDAYTYSHYVSDGLNSIEKQDVSAGQNDYSEVSLDLQQASGVKVRIPEFVPANTPPTANLQLDRATVFSGIENITITGNAIGYAYVPRIDDSLSDFFNGVEVIYKTTTGRILKETINATSKPSAGDSVFPSDTSTNGYLEEVLSVKIIKLKEGSVTSKDLLGPDERLHILYRISPAKADVTADNVITTVSLGNPIQTLDRPGYSVLLDGSTSQTKASNINIDKYIFDTGKLVLSSTNTDPYLKSTKESISDIITGSSLIYHVGTLSSSHFDQESSKLKEYYTFRPNKGNIIDNVTKRFYDEERLIRLQAVDDSNQNFADSSTLYYDDANKRDSTWNTNEAVDATETSIDVTGGTWMFYDGLRAGAVIQIEDERMQINDVNHNWKKLTSVERGFDGTTAVDHGAAGDDIYVVPSGGRTSDSAKWSFLEHWNPTIYYDDVNRPTSLKSRGLLLYANSSTLKGFNTLGEEVWTNRDSEYKHNNLTFTDDTSVNGNPSLVFGGLWKQNYNRGTATPNYTQLTHGHRGGHNKRPSNWLLLCKTDKFNKIHVRLENLFNGLPAGSISYSDLIYENVKVNISMWYVAQTASYSSAVEWKPLSFVDGTSTGGNAESLRKSGTLYFDIPDDWEKKKASNIAQWDGTTGNPVPEQDGTTLNEDPISLWTEDMYSILIGISVDGGQRALDNDWQYKIQCPYIQTYNNSHSRAITIKDPHHKSLNDITIAQNISWNRSGKIMQLADRFGRSELRKIGANGGSVSFGGVELGGTNYDITKAAILRYQREATPVYLDITRENGDFVRFYGVIESLSEDVPTGKAVPKWGVNMIIEYISEFDSNGAWISKGLMSLGGEIIDEPKYLL